MASGRWNVLPLCCSHEMRRKQRGVSKRNDIQRSVTGTAEPIQSNELKTFDALPSARSLARDVAQSENEISLSLGGNPVRPTRPSKGVMCAGRSLVDVEAVARELAVGAGLSEALSERMCRCTCVAAHWRRCTCAKGTVKSTRSSRTRNKASSERICPNSPAKPEIRTKLGLRVSPREASFSHERLTLRGT